MNEEPYTLRITYPSGAIGFLHKNPLGKMSNEEFLEAVKEQYGEGVKIEEV